MAHIWQTTRVRELSQEIVDKQDEVWINPVGVTQIAKKITPAEGKPLEGQPDFRSVLYCLIANSINYCYWYGWHEVRPSGAGASTMHKILKDNFEKYFDSKEAYAVRSTSTQAVRSIATQDAVVSNVTRHFYEDMAMLGFPLMQERYAHLQELQPSDCRYFYNSIKDKLEVNHIIKCLLAFPGYFSDPFLKRAQLFCSMLHREVRCVEDLKRLTIPADYQVPKMLRFMGAITYDNNLATMIRLGRLIPKGSKYEVAIRAASIIACDRIAEEAGVTPSEVDKFLWTQRNECDEPFHLTVTTDY